MAKSQTPKKEKKNTSAFSLSKEADDIITERAEAEMGGNRSKWLDKHLVALKKEKQ